MHVLIAFIVAMATTMPAGVRAMPMPSAGSGMAADQPCQNCPQPNQTGNMNPDKMPACQALACADALAMLPTPALVHVARPVPGCLRAGSAGALDRSHTRTRPVPTETYRPPLSRMRPAAGCGSEPYEPAPLAGQVPVCHLPRWS